jgi:protocatechuate 3,4-dioxygenase beta subunit
MARRRLGPTVVVLAALVACLLVAWQLGAVEAIEGWFSREPDDARGGGLAGPSDAEVAEELERRLTLRGLPGVEAAGPTGKGALVGSVKLYRAGAPALPLPGVEVLLLRAQGKKEAAATARVTSAEDGAFEARELAAPASYALVIRHPPYREVVRMGLGVAAGRVTDVGEILLGAPTSLAGEVVDASGRAVAGAVVQVFPDKGRADTFDLRRGLFDLQAAADPLAQAKAGGDGLFTLGDLSPGRYLLRVSAPGYAVAFRSDVRVTVDERSGRVRVVLDPGAGWVGTVEDEGGRGIAGARLVAVALPGERLQRLDRVDVVAGPDGAYRLDTLVSGVRYFVEAWAEGHSPSGQVLVAEGVKRRDVRLTASGRVEGRVTDKRTGAAVAGAEVMLVAGNVATLSPVSAVTDEAGQYVLPYVSPGPILLFSVKAAGYEAVSQGGDVLKGRAVVAGGTLVLDAGLERGGTVGGRVLDAAGRPIPYAEVSVADPRRRWEGEESVLADAQGTYLLTGLKAGTYELRVTAPGFAPIVGEEECRVVVTPEFTPVVRDVKLTQGATLLGVVRSPDGLPVPGAQVEARAAAAGDLRGRVRDLVTFSDGSGAYRLAGVPAAIDVTVSASHDEWVRATHGPIRLGEGQRQEITLVLKAGSTLQGRVVDAHGRAVAEARVRWGAVGPENEDRVNPGDSFRADEALGARVVLTDADGGFKLVRLEPGRMLLKVEKEGFADWYRRDLLVPEVGDPAALTVTLEGALRVTGRVVDDATGRPIAGAWVYAEENKPGADAPQDPGRVRALVAVQTAADGSYALDRLPPQPCKVAVWLAIGYHGQTRRDVLPGSSGVDFRLSPQTPPDAPR